MSWQRRTRIVIAVFGVALAATVGFLIRPRDARLQPAPIERLDPSARIETKGGNVVQLKGAQQDLHVEFEGQMTYADGRTTLTGVTLTVDNRAGRTFVITGREARVGKDNSSYEMTGGVKLTSSDGLVATGRDATFADAEGIVRVPGPVEFTRGRMAGAGIGFTYDQQRDTAWLLDQAVVRFAAEGDLPPMDASAGAAGFARRDRYMRFERGVHMTREGQVIEAGEATVTLFPDRDEADRIELRSDSRITGGGNLGSLQLMSARDINLDYADDGRTLQQATLSGRAAVRLAGEGGGDGLRLNGEWVDLSLAADGAVTSLASRDGVTVTLPAPKGEPARIVRATEMSGRGDGGQGLTAMRFQSAVEFREAATAERPLRTARARQLDLKLAPSSGSLEEARFTGAFQFQEGAMTASSADARYQIVDGRLDLSGREGGRAPHVADERLTVDADTIDVVLNPRRMVARGSVGTTMLPQRSSGPGGQAGKRPALLRSTDPVSVLAATLEYDQQTRRAVYAGQSRLFQGDTSIRAESITVDETAGDLIASGSVLTTLALTEGDESKPSAPTIARGSTFRYEDAARRAAYDTSAQMDGRQGSIRAERIELYLEPDDNRLSRLEATGGVTVIVDKRKATGARLTYRPAGEEYVMVGAPVELLEECQETAGKTMRFFRSSERVQVDGNDQQRTLAKGGKCPETRRK
jgi:lipopolysaccharide export system protein LptA